MDRVVVRKRERDKMWRRLEDVVIALLSSISDTKACAPKPCRLCAR